MAGCEQLLREAQSATAAAVSALGAVSEARESARGACRATSLKPIRSPLPARGQVETVPFTGRTCGGRIG